MCESTHCAISSVWLKEYDTPEEKYLSTRQLKDDLLFNIQKMKINKHTLYVLITFTDMKKYSPISRLLFSTLFNYKNQLLIELMSELNASHSYIREAPDGEIDLYGIRFKRYHLNEEESF